MSLVRENSGSLWFEKEQYMNQAKDVCVGLNTVGRVYGDYAIAFDE